MNRILVVDDEEYLVEILTEIISTSVPDVTVDFAYNGKEALAKCKEHKYSLITLDYKMPVMGGEEFINTLYGEKQQNSDTPIIMITAFPEDAKNVKDKHNIFITKKPFDTKELLKTIKLVMIAGSKRAG